MDFRNVDVPTATSNPPVDPSWPWYPQNLFGNWTPDQVKRSQMLAKCPMDGSSTIYWMDVGKDGKFTNAHTSTVTAPYHEFWDMLQGEVNLTCHLCPRLGG